MLGVTFFHGYQDIEGRKRELIRFQQIQDIAEDILYEPVQICHEDCVIPIPSTVKLLDVITGVCTLEVVNKRVIDLDGSDVEQVHAFLYVYRKLCVHRVERAERELVARAVGW